MDFRSYEALGAVGGLRGGWVDRPPLFLIYLIVILHFFWLSFLGAGKAGVWVFQGVCEMD